MTKEMQERYAAALEAYRKAKEELESILGARQNAGFSPPPELSTRFKLPTERRGLTHSVQFQFPDQQQFRMFIQTGEYSDGSLGEVFLKADKQGSMISGLMDVVSLLLSLALQFGIPLERISQKLKGTQFAREGRVVGKAPVRNCTSVIDYVIKWLELRYPPKEEQYGRTDENAG